MNSYQKLEKLVSDGYVLHGSKHKFKIATPRKKEKLHHTVGLEKAVYATTSPLLAIFRAVVNSSTIPKVQGIRNGLLGWRFKNEDDQPEFWVTPKYIKYHAFKKGYVYAFEKSKFKKSNKDFNEYYSMKRIKPTEIIEVEPEELLSRTKLNIWTEEEVRDVNLHTEEEIKAMGF